MRLLVDPAAFVADTARRQVVLIDARGGADARARFEAAHVAGARFVDLEVDLATPPANAAEGGRHPLPDPAAFAEVLGGVGIDQRSLVVVYDDKNGANAAARFWWMLTALGHRDVQVLDGGLAAATAAGVPIEAGPDRARAAGRVYRTEGWCRPLADADEVARAAGDAARLVIDVREEPRFAGVHEPIDTVAGHIPGAINVPYFGNLEADGRFLPVEALAKKYREVLGGRDPSRVIVHCGSGVTACHTILAMEQAGLTGARLYVGSWSEWSRSGRAIAVAEDAQR